MLWFQNEARYWAVKLSTDVNMPPVMPDEDKIFGGSLVLDFRKWWRHVKTIYTLHIIHTEIKFSIHSFIHFSIKMLE